MHGSILNVYITYMHAPPTLMCPTQQQQEKAATLASLRRRASKLTAGLGQLEGVSVQPSDGAMYSFPRVWMGMWGGGMYRRRCKSLPTHTLQPSNQPQTNPPKKQIALPTRFLAEAAAQQTPPDQLYALKLVQATGIVVVPGSGFGQVEGACVGVCLGGRGRVEARDPSFDLSTCKCVGVETSIHQSIQSNPTRLTIDYPPTIYIYTKTRDVAFPHDVSPARGQDRQRHRAPHRLPQRPARPVPRLISQRPACVCVCVRRPINQSVSQSNCFSLGCGARGRSPLCSSTKAVCDI